MITDEIQNVELLTGIFGQFPSFHDAEVIELSLSRENEGHRVAAMKALIHVWATTSEVENRKLVLKNHCQVSFKFNGIFGLLLENFNRQNVISGLYIEAIGDDNLARPHNDTRLRGVTGKAEVDSLKFHVKFGYSFGIEADFLCKEIIIESVRELANDPA